MDDLYTIDDALSLAQCEEAIAEAEGRGFTAAPITIGPSRFAMRPDIRNNTRVMLDDPERAAVLFAQLKDRLPASYRGFHLSGLNERFRFYRYRAGQAFRWHHDGPFERDDGERSFYTLLFYLNDDFEGGATQFSGHQVEPRAGRALVFFHPLLHQGAEVTRGVKYVLRTDVMFRRA